MLYYPFSNYEGFKEIFELREHGNGVKSRRNQILLAFFKSPKLMKWCHKYDDMKLLQVTNMTQLRFECLKRLIRSSYDFPGKVYLKERRWGSSLYRTDYMYGKTEDGDVKSIRYVRLDNDKIFKMRAGKMYRHLILETEFGQMLPEQVVVWLCEELVLEWSGYNTQSGYELHVDDDFAGIYDSCRMKGSFGSCMTDEERDSFYSDCVNAKAAYLTNENNRIVARAVIYNEVHEKDSSKIWRLCERQYSTDCDDSLKQILVNRLVQEGYIDGYKRVGADCHSSHAFVDIEGRDLSDKLFWIECNLGYDDKLSYQDSFKWYDINKNIAYNYNPVNFTHMLDTTSRHIENDQNYDEYHEEWTSNDTVSVYYNGDWISCDEDRLDDFIFINDSYYHEDSVSPCDYCGSYYVPADREWYSEVTDESYCCERCMKEAEEKYCEDNPDEYVWIDGEAVARERVTFCEMCGEPCVDDDYVLSDLTGEVYCCDECKQKAEHEYYKNHPDCGYAVCSECDEVKPLDEMTENEDRTYTCKECASWIQNFKIA